MVWNFDAVSIFFRCFKKRCRVSENNYCDSGDVLIIINNTYHVPNTINLYILLFWQIKIFFFYYCARWTFVIKNRRIGIIAIQFFENIKQYCDIVKQCNSNNITNYFFRYYTRKRYELSWNVFQNYYFEIKDSKDLTTLYLLIYYWNIILKYKKKPPLCNHFFFCCWIFKK